MCSAPLRHFPFCGPCLSPLWSSWFQCCIIDTLSWTFHLFFNSFVSVPLCVGAVGQWCLDCCFTCVAWSLVEWCLQMQCSHEFKRVVELPSCPRGEQLGRSCIHSLGSGSPKFISWFTYQAGFDFVCRSWCMQSRSSLNVTGIHGQILHRIFPCQGFHMFKFMCSDWARRIPVYFGLQCECYTVGLYCFRFYFLVSSHGPVVMRGCSINLSSRIIVSGLEQSPVSQQLYSKLSEASVEQMSRSKAACDAVTTVVMIFIYALHWAC